MVKLYAVRFGFILHCLILIINEVQEQGRRKRMECLFQVDSKYLIKKKRKKNTTNEGYQ